MKYLLEQEGIVVIDDKIQNFKKHFWHPLHELNLEEE
jgi:methylated-DNA-protein-cysteine methyltransferase-like protein